VLTKYSDILNRLRVDNHCERQMTGRITTAVACV